MRIDNIVEARIGVGLRIQKHFFAYQMKVERMCPNKPWIVPVSTLFGRLDSALERFKEVASFNPDSTWDGASLGV